MSQRLMLINRIVIDTFLHQCSLKLLFLAFLQHNTYGFFFQSIHAFVNIEHYIFKFNICHIILQKKKKKGPLSFTFYSSTHNIVYTVITLHLWRFMQLCVFLLEYIKSLIWLNKNIFKDIPRVLMNLEMAGCFKFHY